MRWVGWHSAFRVAFAPVTLIGLIHASQGVILLFDPGTALAAGLSGLRGFSNWWAATILLSVGVAAIIGRTTNVHWGTSFALIMPQQLVLMMQLAGIATALYFGRYPDGYVPVADDWLASFLFILSDQIAWIFLALSHLLDMVVAPYINAAIVKRDTVLNDVNETLAWYRENWEYRPGKPDREPEQA